jgi:penicillin G amidase
MGGVIRRLVRAASVATALVPCAAWSAQATSALSDVPTTTYHVNGLSAPAEILVDVFGVPHLYANSLYEVFFVQGFNAARDRLWQIDTWRRRGLGRMAEVFGEAFVEQDRAARLFLFRGDMYREWLSYGSDSKQVAEAYVAGVNAFIDLLERRPELMPFEFKTLGYAPERWHPADVVRIRSHGLVRNVEDEAKRARVACVADLETDLMRQGLEPAWTPQVPAGLDLCAVPEDVLKDYDLATATVDLSPEKLRGEAPDERGDAGDGVDPRSLGSNNWAIAADRTTTGRPILANDPHRSHSVPSLRYIAHLVAPELDVIGAGEPALPGISIGHNDRIAFGLTIFSIDQEDLYVYETNPEVADEYRYQGRWEPMEVVEETVAVEGGESREVTLKFTRHGPVVYEDKENNRAFAVRAAWLEPGMAPYFGSVDYMRARNLDEFLAAMNRWGAPSENQVFADTAGDIAWVPGGLTPLRPNWDGLLPVPGDGSYEWSGFLTQDRLPREINPERGWVATANQMNLPDDYPYQELKLGFEWTAPYRYNRIAEVLSKSKVHSIADSIALQTDVKTWPAVELLPVAAELKPEDERATQALELLADWDGRLTTESAAAAIFEVWLMKHLSQAVVQATVPEAVVDIVETGDIKTIIDLLKSPDGRLGDQPALARDRIMLESLDAALRELEERLGPDMQTWAWGDLHHALFEHDLADFLEGRERAMANVGPLPKGGSGYTVNNANYRPSDFRVTSGASWRMVIDVGNWDNSWAVSAPGQSGDPTNTHYRDLFAYWADERYVPLAYSRERVESLTHERIVLQPAGESY